MKHPLNVCYTEGTKFAKEYYVTHFKQFVDQKESFNVASIESYGVERMGNEKDREKFFALLPKGIPTLMQIRNPIGIVKHGIVRNWECISDIPQMTRVFNLTFDYHYFCKFLEKKEFKLPDNFESKKAQGYFYNSIIQALKPQNLTYMDMSEISKERAFDTFCRLSKIFGFDAPKEENRKIFEAQNMKGNLLFLWSLAPLQLHCHIEDVQNCYSKTKQNHSANPQIRQGSLVIFIINPNVIKGFVDIMGEFSSTLQNDVGFYIAQQDWERLHSDKKLWNAVRKYLQEFLDFLEETTREQEKRSLSEWDVLELLRKNKAARESLWNVLDLELAHIKATRPDIVASWETYLEFEKMCKKG